MSQPTADGVAPAEPTGRILGPGTVLGRYVVLKALGRGGTGTVYAAYDNTLGRKVALKLLHAVDGSGEAHERLLREAHAMARLAHPNVVAIYDVGAHGGDVFLAMEYVDGATLSEWLEAPHGWREIRDVLRQAGRGLEAAHAAGLVHRDFKPDNVLIARDGRVAVTDFGIACAGGSAARRAPAPRPTGAAPTAEALEGALTQEGSVLGTVGFMAPEQVWESSADTRSDLFSFCVTAYRALYGRMPFAADSVEGYLRALDGPAPVLPSGAKVPAWLGAVLLRGLHHAPEERHPSMSAVLAAIDRDPTRARLAAAAVAVLLLALAGSALGWAAHRRAAVARCREGARLIETSWGPDARRRVMEAMTASPAAAGRTALALDAYAGRWAAAHREASEATLLRGELSGADLGKRLACLERRREELEALVEEIAGDGKAAAGFAVSAAYRLVSPRVCLEPVILRSLEAEPPGPGERQRALAERRAFARVAVLRSTGKWDLALAEIERLLAEVRASDQRALETEVLFLKAELRDVRGEITLAVPAYMQAFAAADRLGDDVTAVRAAAAIALLTSNRLRRAPEAEAWLAVARGKLEHAGASDLAELRVLNAQIALLGDGGRVERTMPLHARLVELCERIFGPDHPSTAAALHNHAADLGELGRYGEALAAQQRALAIVERTRSDGDPDLALDHDLMGELALALGRYGDAERSYRHALNLRAPLGPDDGQPAWSLAGLAAVANRVADAPRALELAGRGLAMAGAHPEDDAGILPTLLVEQGVALLTTGAPGAALGACQRALALQEGEGALTADRIYRDDALACVGEAQLALGQPREAVRSLERSAALVRRKMPGSLALARFGLARALWAAGGDRRRALALAEEARTELVSLPGRAREAAEVARWREAAGR